MNRKTNMLCYYNDSIDLRRDAIQKGIERCGINVGAKLIPPLVNYE